MNDDSSRNATPAWVIPLAAGAITVAFAVMCGMMLYWARHLSEDDQFAWNRLLFVFNAVQAIATTAAGALLGTTVQQARVANAEGRAADAEANAKLNADDATKAQAARRLIDGLQPPGGGKSAASIEAVGAVLH